jgi:hypothetical protein
VEKNASKIDQKSKLKQENIAMFNKNTHLPKPQKGG